jgi:hypothetical protein
MINDMIDSKYQDEIIDHYTKIWESEFNIYLWDKGPIEKLPYNYRVLEFAPNNTREMWIYATCCMSNPEDKIPIELHIFSSKQDVELVELLTIVTYYHHNTSQLNLNHTINFGKSWQNKSECKYGLISLPYLYGPNLENYYRSDCNKTSKFYWLIPVTKKEVNFKKKFGVEALEQKFDIVQLNYLDPLRSSVI